jgi:tRNA A-37 threonylcarbamoyl transferase component Bud32
VADRADDLDQTRRMIAPGGRPTGVDTVPLDRTMVGARERARSSPLPPISVSEPTDDAATSARRAPPGPTGPDLVVLGVLGEGGMGRVQLARQRSLQREVALKRPRSDASDREARGLRDEALVTGHLEHPNIVPVHALGVDEGGLPVIVMKRVEGVSWRDLLRDADHPGWVTREPDPAARLVWHLGILAQLCNAIAFAHSRGIVHRDMKPDNVMIGEFGEVYLIDWGVAVESGARSRDETGRAMVVGTPCYMAPEMARGGPIDELTDVYLLGATLHEVLTGSVRHIGRDIAAATAQAIASEPYRYGGDVPEELAALANQACAADPARRPRGALAFRHALLAHLRHRGSLRLSAAADRGMAAIEVEAATTPVPGAAHSRAIEECRFGYREALHEWPDNPDAVRGLRRCALATVRHELARRDPLAARAALAELVERPPDLIEAVAALEASLAAEEADRERLRQLERDADPTVGAPTGGLMFAILLVVGSSLAVYAVRVHTTGTIEPFALVLFPILTVSGTLTFMFLFRRQLAVNAFNRRLAAWFLSLAVLLVASRTIGQATGIALHHQFITDALLLAAMFTAGGLFLFRWMWMDVGVMLLSAAIAALVPSAAHIALQCANAFAVITAAFLVPRRRGAI